MDVEKSKLGQDEKRIRKLKKEVMRKGQAHGNRKKGINTEPPYVSVPSITGKSLTQDQVHIVQLMLIPHFLDDIAAASPVRHSIPPFDPENPIEFPVTVAFLLIR